jgi:hypothetical protein
MNRYISGLPELCFSDRFISIQATAVIHDSVFLQHYTKEFVEWSYTPFPCKSHAGIDEHAILSSAEAEVTRALEPCQLGEGQGS